MTPFRSRYPVIPALALALLALIGAGVRSPAAAAESPAFTVLVSSAFLRDEPNRLAGRTYSVFQGQVYGVVGRNADNSWLQLDFAGASRGTWIWSPLGKVTGSLAGVPVTAEAGGATAAQAVPAAPASTGGGPASGPAKFTVAAQSIFAHLEPSLNSPRIQSLFHGQTFNVLARTPDGQWVKLDSAGQAWVFTLNGMVTGSWQAVPVWGATSTAAAPLPATATPAAPAAPASPAVIPPVPAISARAREIYHYGLTLGNNPHVFAKVGDCNSVPPYFLVAFDNPNDYRLGSQYAGLAAAISNFSGSFSRSSQAARIGFSTTSVLSSQWADPKVCKSAESALACEYRLIHPSLALISLGTNGEWLTDADYELGQRHIIEYSIQHGVVPILGTKADDVEGGGRYNAIIVKLANEYSIPLWDFRAAAVSLPDRGLMPDGFHLTWGPAYFDDPAQITTGWQVRNLTALQMLDAVWRAVK
jgi:hypothetical protein